MTNSAFFDFILDVKTSGNCFCRKFLFHLLLLSPSYSDVRSLNYLFMTCNWLIAEFQPMMLVAPSLMTTNSNVEFITNVEDTGSAGHSEHVKSLVVVGVQFPIYRVTSAFGSTRCSCSMGMTLASVPVST